MKVQQYGASNVTMQSKYTAEYSSVFHWTTTSGIVCKYMQLLLNDAQHFYIFASSITINGFLFFTNNSRCMYVAVLLLIFKPAPKLLFIYMYVWLLPLILIPPFTLGL